MDLVKKEQNVESSEIIGEQLQKRLTISQQNGQNKRKHETAELPIFRSSQLQNLNFQSQDWLQKICFVSKIHFEKMIQWGQQLLRVIINRQPNILVQSFTRLVYLNEQPKKQTYLCSIKRFGTQIVCIILRDFRGNIILYQKSQQKNKIQMISQLLDTYSKQNLFLINDETGSLNQLYQLINKESAKYKFIYCLKNQFSQEIIASIVQYFNYDRINGISVMYSKQAIKHVVTIQQNISKLVQIQTQQQHQLQYFLGLGQTIVPYFADRYFFLAKMLKQMIKLSPPNCFNSEAIVTNLQDGIQYLKDYFNRRNVNKNKHYPRRGEAKTYCSYCNKKKTEAYCQGCLKVQNKLRYLCISGCYGKYHHYLQNLSSTSRVQISRNIDYFDKKCSQIEQTMNAILNMQDNPEVLFCFLQFSNSKVSQYLNMAAEKHLRNEREDRDD